MCAGVGCTADDEHAYLQAHEVHADLVEPSGLVVAGPGRYYVADDDRGVLLVDETNVTFSDRVDKLFDRPAYADVIPIAPSLKDLEGACFINGVLFVVAEETGVITSVSEDGKRIVPYGTLARPLPAGVEPHPNRGFEGIAFLPAALSPDKKDHLVAAHEKHPKAIALYQWPSLAPEKYFVLEGELDATLGDVADVAVDPKTGELLLLSAAAHKYARVKLADLTNGPLVMGEVREISVRRDEKPEGITVDERGGVWLCTDGSGRLFRMASVP